MQGIQWGMILFNSASGLQDLLKRKCRSGNQKLSDFSIQEQQRVKMSQRIKRFPENLFATLLKDSDPKVTQVLRVFARKTLNNSFMEIFKKVNVKHLASKPWTKVTKKNCPSKLSVLSTWFNNTDLSLGSHWKLAFQAVSGCLCVEMSMSLCCCDLALQALQVEVACFVPRRRGLIKRLCNI